MKINEMILHTIGLVIICLSVYGFFFMGVSFSDSTMYGLGGLALNVLSVSQIRNFISVYFKKKIK